jgi:predicted amidohydrolase
MKVAYVQTRPVFGDLEGNLRRAMKRAEAVRADLVVLPELFTTGYRFRDRAEARRYAEPAQGGLATRAAREVAARTGAFVVGGFAEAAGRKVYNSAFLVGPEGLVATYRKVHLFGSEREAFDEGDRPFAVHDIGAAVVGMIICFDWVFPESARSLALLGAEVIAHPANLVLPWCPDAMVTRCLENGVFAVTAGRVGRERRAGDSLAFIGSSRIVGPDGKVLASASRDRVETGAATIDPARARDKRLGRANDRFADRRPAMYRG